MGIFSWNEQYSVQVGLMDEQHKNIFDLLNQLHEAMATGKGSEKMGEILSGLKKYAATHFSDEEKFLDQFHYPGLAEQRHQHNAFIKKVEEYEKSLSEKKIGLSLEVMNFMKNWLVSHIQESDRKYAETFHQHGMK